MLRVIIINLLMFAVPFVLYTVFQLVTRVDDGRSSAVEGMPLLPLTLAGTALVAVTLAVTATMSEKHQGAYEPAVVIDGKVQPGRIK